MRKYFIRILFIIAFALAGSFAVPQGPPPPGGGPTEHDPPVGAAPSGEGIVILLTLASAFGAVKIFGTRK